MALFFLGGRGLLVLHLLLGRGIALRRVTALGRGIALGRVALRGGTLLVVTMMKG